MRSSTARKPERLAVQVGLERKGTVVFRAVHDDRQGCGIDIPRVPHLQLPQIPHPAIRGRCQQTSHRRQAATLEKIAQSSGGSRTLRLQVPMDRVVAGELATMLMPQLDQHLLHTSHGFRPQEEIEKMLAERDVTMEGQDCWTTAVTDTPRAPDYGCIADALEDQRQHVKEDGRMGLNETSRPGKEVQGQAEGGDQSRPVSPQRMSLQMHHCLALPHHAAEPATPFWHRNADGTASKSQDEIEGQQALNSLTRQMPAETGAEQGGTAGSIRPRRAGPRSELFGFQRRHGQDGGPRSKRGKKRRQNLERALGRHHCHHKRHERPQRLRRGGLGCAMPTFESAEGRAKLRKGSRGLPCREARTQVWKRSWSRPMRSGRPEPGDSTGNGYAVVSGSRRIGSIYFDGYCCVRSSSAALRAQQFPPTVCWRRPTRPGGKILRGRVGRD